MSGQHIFDTTTTRSSNVGQPLYDTLEDWQHFLDKYRDAGIRFVKQLSYGRADLAEDAFSEVYAKILTNPNILQRKPSVRFRAVLETLLRNAAINLIRKERAPSRERYEKLTEPLRTESVTQDDDREQLALYAIDLIRQDMLRPDYENGRFAREYNSLDLDIWIAMQQEGATFTNVKHAFGISSNDTIREAVARVDARIVREARAMLDSLGLV